MRPLPFVWPYALVFWATYALAFLPEWKIVQDARKSAKRADSQDDESLRVIMSVQMVALLIAFGIAFVRVWSFPARARLPWFFGGVVLWVVVGRRNGPLPPRVVVGRSRAQDHARFKAKVGGVDETSGEGERDE